MDRAQMVEQGAVALFESPDYLARKGVGMDDARAVLDAVLPQVSTVEELEALPDRVVVLDAEGCPFRRRGADWYWPGSDDWYSVDEVAGCAPLTVVWRP